MTDEGWRYFCSDCNDFHHIDAFYKSKEKPFGIFPSCSAAKKTHARKKREKPNSAKNVDTSYLKLNKVNDSDINNTIDLLERLGYDTTGNVHEQFLNKYKNEIRKTLSQR